MRKTLILTVIFLLGLFAMGAGSALAYDAGCTGAGPYSITTGQFCYGSQSTYYSQAQYQPQYQYQQPVVVQASSAFTRELSFGARGNDVVNLQQLLSNRGYSVGRIDGVFGSRTRNAVINYQLDSGLSATGVADSETLARLSSTVSTAAYASSTPTIYSPNCPLVFVNGVVQRTCQPLPVPPPIPTQRPVISGVSGPQSLNVNQQGTWTVSASSVYGGNLSYSVNWGDQPMYAYGTNNSLSYPQQSATFTHTYVQAGTYTPVFTVTNNLGQTATTSLSVYVSGNYNNSFPTISYLSPSSGRVGTQVTVFGSGFGFGSNNVYFGSYVVPNIYSYNGTSLTFTVPQTGTTNCFSYPCSQNFNVSVNNSYNTSNQVNFTLNY